MSGTVLAGTQKMRHTRVKSYTETLVRTVPIQMHPVDTKFTTQEIYQFLNYLTDITLHSTPHLKPRKII